MRVWIAGLGLLLSACTNFAELTVGADSDETEAGLPDAALESDAADAADAASVPPAADGSIGVQVEPDAATPPKLADAAAAEAGIDAGSPGAHDSSVDAAEETYDGGKTCCERWEEFLGAPPLQPCAELRCTSVLPPPPPRLPTLPEGGLLPPFFDAAFP